MADLLRVSIVGALPSGEEWSVNPVWSLGGDFGGVETTPAQIATVAQAIADITHGASLIQNFNTSTTITGARVEARTYAGLLENLAEAARSTPQAGSGAQSHSFQTAWVSSLRTSQPGASGRGRLYWPATGVTLVSTTLRPSSSTLTQFVAGVETALSQIGAAIAVTYPVGAALCVWSRKLQRLFAVNTIQAGDVLDNQRRRRDALVESYASLPFTP